VIQRKYIVTFSVERNTLTKQDLIPNMIKFGFMARTLIIIYNLPNFSYVLPLNQPEITSSTPNNRSGFGNETGYVMI